MDRLFLKFQTDLKGLCDLTHMASGRPQTSHSIGASEQVNLKI